MWNSEGVLRQGVETATVVPKERLKRHPVVYAGWRLHEYLCPGGESPYTSGITACIKTIAGRGTGLALRSDPGHRRHQWGRNAPRALVRAASRLGLDLYLESVFHKQQSGPYFIVSAPLHPLLPCYSTCADWSPHPSLCGKAGSRKLHCDIQALFHQHDAATISEAMQASKKITYPSGTGMVCTAIAEVEAFGLVLRLLLGQRKSQAEFLPTFIVPGPSTTRLVVTPIRDHEWTCPVGPSVRAAQGWDHAPRGGACWCRGLAVVGSGAARRENTGKRG